MGAYPQTPGNRESPSLVAILFLGGCTLPVPLCAPDHLTHSRRFEPRHNSISPAEVEHMAKFCGFDSMDALVEATVGGRAGGWGGGGGGGGGGGPPPRCPPSV